MNRKRMRNCGLGVVAFLVMPFPPVVAADPPTLAELMKAKRDLAKKSYETIVEQWTNPPGKKPGWESFHDVIRWSRRWSDSELELSTKQEDKVRALEDHVKRVKPWVERAKIVAEAGVFSDLEVKSMEYKLLKAEVRLRKAREAKP